MNRESRSKALVSRDFSRSRVSMIPLAWRRDGRSQTGGVGLCEVTRSLKANFCENHFDILS